MARQKNSVPRFCIDKNGRAFTKVAGRFISLGRAELPESKLRFAKVLEDHAKGLLVERAAKPAEKRSGISVSELLLLLGIASSIRLEGAASLFSF